ncbi:MAG: uroporphyrinogen-III synthase [Bryobacteraceae bacterium]|nr:uroporphyrinogen-III synthase [Bryobacteraceae bacterium]
MSPVSFVGAGPGDPELLTIRAKRAIEEADVVYHDELVPREIWSLAREAHRYESPTQLAEAARAGRRVVRLQVGDPTIFGRLVEQMEALDEAGVEYEIVPGVTAATAAAARAKISLTHSTLGRSVAFISGHDASAPVPNADTIAMYMPKRELPGPKIVVSEPREGREDVSIAIHGAVTALKSLPLYGQRVIVTRAETSRLNDLLRAQGAEPIDYPVIAIVPPADPVALERAVANARDYDWIVFTSQNGVRAFFSRLADLRALRGKLCAIGPATAAEIEKHKLIVDVVPAEYVAEGLIAALPENLAGQRILIPRAAVARDVVPNELRRRGAFVEVVEAYRTVVPDGLPPTPHDYHWITFTSSSTVKNFLALGGKPVGKAASIGPITSATLRMHGVEPVVEAREYTVEGLVQAILIHVRNR